VFRDTKKVYIEGTRQYLKNACCGLGHEVGTTYIPIPIRFLRMFKQIIKIENHHLRYVDHTFKTKCKVFIY